jgi:hypothetical protein
MTTEPHDKWLDLTTVRAILRLPPKGARNWVKRHCPREGVKLAGRCLMVSTWAVNQGLRHCVWRPDIHQPRGFQGHPGQVAPNVHCRDDLGRFTSHRSSPPPPRRKGFVHPRRRPYLRST